MSGEKFSSSSRSSFSESVKTRKFPFINAESWRSPAHFVGDVIKDSASPALLEFGDIRSLVSDKDPKIITTLVEAMIKTGLRLDDSYGQIPLFNILNSWGDRYQDLVKLIIDPGAQIDTVNNHGQTPLTRAAGKGYVWAVEMLVDAGANPKGTPLVSPLNEASYYGRLEVVRYLIEKVNCPPGLINRDGATPLHRACLGAQVQVVKYLLERCRLSVDIEARTGGLFSQDNGHSMNASPLIDAYVNKQAFADRLEVIKVLLEHGAQTTVSRGPLSGNWSLLHHAAKDGKIELVKVLLQYPVKISTRSVPVFGSNPISLAEARGHKEIVELLLAEKKARKERSKASHHWLNV